MPPSSPPRELSTPQRPDRPAGGHDPSMQERLDRLALPRDLSMQERLDLLTGRPGFRGVGGAALEEIAVALECVHVPGGARLVKRGETGVPFFLVGHGGLQASFVDSDGHPHVVFEYFRGSSVGEALLLSGRPSPLDLYAIRDSLLLRLTRERFDALVARRPELSLGIAQLLAARLSDVLALPEALAPFCRATDRLPRSIVVLSGGGDDVRRTGDLVAAALSRTRRAARLTTHDGHDAVSEVRSGRCPSLELVILECDTSDSGWLDFCLRQADRVMVLAQAGAAGLRDGSCAGWDSAKFTRLPGRIELALVHPRLTAMPHASPELARLPGVVRVHHVRAGDENDAERLARWLMDRPVGLVLGGGGAYGIAHVGIFKALEEARVPVDIVGGTSMGALFAGGVAMGWSADRMMEQVRLLFASRWALYDPTVPFRSLLAGRKMDRVLERFFGGIRIADLWRPFFCVATNISRARLHVNECGSLKDAIRSSCSIPGLFPPHRAGGEVLVDGGLVDNLPIDIMADRCHGPIVAVDVFPYERGAKAGGPARGSVFERMRRLKPLSAPVFDTLTRSTFVGSQRATEQALSRHPPALHLVLTLSEFGILEWHAYEALFQAGYACAKRRLDAGALPRSLWEGRVDGAHLGGI